MHKKYTCVNINIKKNNIFFFSKLISISETSIIIIIMKMKKNKYDYNESHSDARNVIIHHSQKNSAIIVSAKCMSKQSVNHTRVFLRILLKL